MAWQLSVKFRNFLYCDQHHSADDKIVYKIECKREYQKLIELLKVRHRKIQNYKNQVY
jgi:hypothetical protein